MRGEMERVKIQLYCYSGPRSRRCALALVGVARLLDRGLGIDRAPRFSLNMASSDPSCPSRSQPGARRSVRGAA